MIWTPWSAWSWWFERLRAGQIQIPWQTDEDPPEDRPVIGEPHETDTEDPVSDETETEWAVRSVGCWVGFGSFVKNSSIERDIAFAKKLGLGRLDVIVNDHSAHRMPRDFGTYNKSRITALCKRAVEEGFAVHLMTWCMPHENYIRQLGTQLTDLLGECGAQSIQLDAEEPWTNARKPMNWEEAGALMAEVLDPVPFGVTGIGYASTKKLGPLVRRAAYMVPQCYSTAKNKLNPVTACPGLVDRWRRKFGDRDVVVGLAGYRQQGRPGYTKDRFMTTAFDAATSTKPTDIVYWSLRHVRGSRSTANIIQKLAQSASRRAVA